MAFQQPVCKKEFKTLGGYFERQMEGIKWNKKVQKAKTEYLCLQKAPLETDFFCLTLT